MIRIAVCDEDQESCYNERDCLQAVLNNAGVDCKIDLFFDTEHLYRSLHDRLYDLLVTDTSVGGNDMFSFVKQLREEQYPLRVLFVAEDLRDAPRAFEVFALSYFQKPLSADKLKSALSYISCLRVLNRHLHVSAKNGEKYRIFENDIRYIEVFHNDLCIHLADSEIVCRSTLNDFLERLSTSGFIRTHQSFAVNLSYAASLKRYLLTLSDGRSVPVSKQRYSFVRDRFLSQAR